MSEEYINLSADEYEALDGGIRALVSIVVQKLPPVQRKKYAPIERQADALRMEADLQRIGIESVALQGWLNLNAAQKTTGRSYSVVSRLLADMLRLADTHGAMLLNGALAKVVAMAQPEKATIPYLKAILNNVPYASKSLMPAPSAPTPPRPVTPPPTCDAQTTWARVLAILEADLNRASYCTWIQPLTLRALTAQACVIGAPDDTYVFWLNENYRAAFVAAFAAVTGNAPARLDFVADEAAEQPAGADGVRLHVSAVGV